MDTNNSSYCFNFTESALKSNTAVTISLHLIAIVACVLTISFIIVTKQHHQFVNRLILYLMIVSCVWSVTIIAQTLPVIHDNEKMDVQVRQGWEGMCAAIGFITQVVESAKILVVCWIVLYLLLLVNFKYKISRRRHEVIGLVIVVVIPLLFDWIPFSLSRYGLSGLWCWIKLTNKDCSKIFDGIAMMLAIEYIPVLLAVIFTVVSFLSMVITFCRRAYRMEIKWKWTSVYQQGLAEATALMVYPTIYIFIFIFRVIHRTIYIIQIGNTKPPTYTLWVSHSTALGLAGILVPLLHILRPSNLRKFYFCRKFILKKKDLGVVYRSTSAFSTEAFTEGEIFTEKDSISEKGRDSTFYSRSVFNHISDEGVM